MSEPKDSAIQYKQWNTEPVFGPYRSNGNTSLQLRDPRSGSPVATSSVNINVLLPENVVAIKDWTENEGMIDALQEGGVLKNELYGAYPTGGVHAYAYELTDKYDKIRDQQYKENDFDSVVESSQERAMMQGMIGDFHEMEPKRESRLTMSLRKDGLGGSLINQSGAVDGASMSVANDVHSKKPEPKSYKSYKPLLEPETRLRTRLRDNGSGGSLINWSAGLDAASMSVADNIDKDKNARSIDVNEDEDELEL